MGIYNDEPTMNRLEDLRLQRELKEIVLEYVSTIYTPNNPFHHGFALLICRHACDMPPVKSRGRDQSRNGRDEFIMIRAITYTSSDKTKWKVVAESSKAYFGILPALQEFTKDLEREMGRMSEQHGAGKKRSGLFGEDDEEDEHVHAKQGRLLV